MPESPRWITVGELADAFAPGSYTPEPTEDLAGRALDLYFEDGQTVQYRFEPGGRLSWRQTGPATGAPEIDEAYLATKVRESIYFVDLLKHRERATSVSLVLDLGAGIATALIAQLPDEAESGLSLAGRLAQGKELTAVAATFLSGAVDSPFTAGTPRHGTTDELVGKRVEYTYSPTERYEHIYLNEDFYTWHCLRGSEKGLADTDRCHYYKLADDLYFFVWREKIVPTLGAVVVDFDMMRTTGKILGYTGADLTKPANFPVGAHARLLNLTRRDDD